MNRISVEYIVDDTSKEIYEFEKHGNHWTYVGVYYSHRNDKNDIWGDQWSKVYADKRDKEQNDLAVSLGYGNYEEMLDECHEWIDDRIEEIQNKYNPVCQKTKHGKPYYGGCSWGYGSRDGKHTPKMSEKDIINEITRQVSKVKIKL